MYINYNHDSVARLRINSIYCNEKRRGVCSNHRTEEPVPWIWFGTNHHGTSPFYLLGLAGPDEGAPSYRPGPSVWPGPSL